MKIMVIGAHHADPIDLAGGTILNHIQQGDEVIAVAVTDGFNSHIKDEWLEKKAKEWDEYTNKLDQILLTYRQFLLLEKRKEFQDICNNLNIERKMLYFDDVPLECTPTLIAKLMSIIREYKPDIVITHHPNEYSHFDHSACGKAVCIALKKAIQDRGNKYWVPTVYFFAVQFRPETVRLGYIPQAPDILIELSEEIIDKKVNLMMNFESQGLNDLNLLYDRMSSFEGEMGRADGLRYSEGFTLYYPLKIKTLFTNPINKQFYKKEK